MPDQDYGELDLDPDVLIWGGPAPREPAHRPQRIPRVERLMG